MSSPWTVSKKRQRNDEEEVQRYENELQRCRRESPSRRTKRHIDEPGLMEALKRTRISCAPGELRMKNDVAALQRSDIVRIGRVTVAHLGSNALVFGIEHDDRYLVTVTQRYPFDRPTVRNLRTSEEPDLPLLQEWSAVYSLEDVANALFERSQVRDLCLARKPPIFSNLRTTFTPHNAPPPPMPLPALLPDSPPRLHNNGRPSNHRSSSCNALDLAAVVEQPISESSSADDLLLSLQDHHQSFIPGNGYPPTLPPGTNMVL